MAGVGELSRALNDPYRPFGHEKHLGARRDKNYPVEQCNAQERGKQFIHSQASVVVGPSKCLV